MRFVTILICLISGASALDYFIFDVTFMCNIQAHSPTYKVQFVDRDVVHFNADDPITEQYTFVKTPMNHSFTLKGNQTGDEWASYWYEVKGKIFHDCNSKKKVKEVELGILPRCPVDAGTCHYKIVQDLTDKEEFVTNYAEFTVEKTNLDT